MFITSQGNPPDLVINPQSAFVTLRTNVSLTCKADGALSYYWERHHGIIPYSAIGVKTSMLTLIDLQSEDIGNYRCVATNGSGSSKSNYATVTINSKPAL